jgi:hypothetical protein
MAADATAGPHALFRALTLFVAVAEQVLVELETADATAYTELPPSVTKARDAAVGALEAATRSESEDKP